MKIFLLIFGGSPLYALHHTFKTVTLMANLPPDKFNKILII
jgi:hypothetical protein